MTAKADDKAEKPQGTLPPKADTPPRGRGRPTNTQKRADRVEKLGTRFSKWGVWLMFIDQRDAEAVMRHAADCAEATADLADQYPLVAKLVDGAGKGGAAFDALGTFGLLFLELAANHGMAPERYATPLPDDEGQAPPEPATARNGAGLAAQLADLPTPGGQGAR